MKKKKKLTAKQQRELKEKAKKQALQPKKPTPKKPQSKANKSKQNYLKQQQKQAKTKNQVKQAIYGKGITTGIAGLDRDLVYYRNKLKREFEEGTIREELKGMSANALDYERVKQKVIDPYRELGFDELVNVIQSLPAKVVYIRERFIGQEADINSAWEDYHDWQISDDDIFRDSGIYSKKQEEERLISVWSTKVPEEDKLVEELPD